MQRTQLVRSCYSTIYQEDTHPAPKMYDFRDRKTNNLRIHQTKVTHIEKRDV